MSSNLAPTTMVSPLIATASPNQSDADATAGEAVSLALWGGVPLQPPGGFTNT